MPRQITGTFRALLFVSSSLLPALAGADEETPPIVLEEVSVPLDLNADPEKDDLGMLCWVPPGRVRAAQQSWLGEQNTAAARETAPEHILYTLHRIPSRVKDARREGCALVLDFTRKVRSGRGELDVDVRRTGDREAMFERTIEIDLADITSEQLKPLWNEVWAALAPPAPLPTSAAPAPEPEEAFVDPELTAKAVERPAPPAREPWFIARLQVGWLSRALDGGPGTSVLGANVLSLGGEAEFDVSTIAELPKVHQIDVRAGYEHRLANGRRGEAGVSVATDQIDALASYRYRLAAGPALGGLIGYQFLRFEVGPTAEALSVRYSVLRVGGSYRQDLARIWEGTLGAQAEAALRLTPGATGGDSNPGFDVAAGVDYWFDRGWVLGLRARYAEQRGNVADADFTDRYFNLDLRAGVKI